jgi:hypothetical protein
MRRGAIALAVATFAILVAGCTGFGAVEPERSSITNQTSVTIDIYLEVAGEEQLLWERLGPGQTTVLNQCTDGDLVARRRNGDEVARRAPPLCPGEQWLIN